MEGYKRRLKPYIVYLPIQEKEVKVKAYNQEDALHRLGYKASDLTVKGIKVVRIK